MSDPLAGRHTLSADCLWPPELLYRALQTLADRAGLIAGPSQERGDSVPGSAVYEDRTRLDQWVRAAGQAIDVAADPLNFALGRLAETVREAAPVLINVAADAPHAPPVFLAVLAVAGEKAHIIDRGGELQVVPLQTVVDRCLGESAIEERKKVKESLAFVLPDVSQAVVNDVLADRFEQRWVAFGWRLQLPATAPLGRSGRRHRLPGSAVGFVLTHVAVHLLWLLSWFLLGRAIFQGLFTPFWFATWALVRLSIIPLRALNGWFQGHFSIGLGGILKRRLLGGAFNIDSDLIKREGVGQLIGRVLEAEALENLLLQGGFLLLSGLIETIIAFWLLSRTAVPFGFMILLTVWLAVLSIICYGYAVQRKGWTAQRLRLTHRLTEKMTGHQTRLAQLPPDGWHADEDKELVTYASAIEGMDRWFVWLRPLTVSGWLTAAAFVLFITLGRAIERPAILAVTIGAILATAVALNKVIQGVSQLIDAWIASQQIQRFLVGETAQPPPPGRTIPALNKPLLSTHQLSFSYRPDSTEVVDAVDLDVYPYDRILLESRSGGGKSTLVALLAGLRTPRSGLVLLNGLDMRTLGLATWRKQIAIAPQFHENHIFLGTMAFNLLMGRRWPPTLEDLAEAEKLCAEIGLRPLLTRMPSGLNQMIGETGWQLSHGERTRIYLARALLQKAPLTILDESFGALDPVTLQQVMDTVRAQDTALLVIAHP